MTPQQQLKWLRSPGQCLPKLGCVHDQQSGQFLPYRADRLTKTLQQQVLEYLDDPPRTDTGQTRFLTVLTARQMGKSLVVEYGCYPKAAYTPGWDHVCIADTNPRADYLHRRVHHLHERWNPALRSPTIPVREMRQLTFETRVGGKMRVLSAETGSVGIGQSPDSFHASECAFWADFGGSMTMIWPSLLNRDHALAVFECTPWRTDSDWYAHCLEAKAGRGRNAYLFAPFWDGVLNSRPWPKDTKPDNHELRLLERYAAAGLTLDHLAFRRFTMEMDAEVRRNPELFDIFYPFDDISCWLINAMSAIPKHAIERHRTPELREPAGVYDELMPPDREGMYVIGADPCGHAARDHAAFQVLDVADGRWTQVATFADHTDPLAFARKLFDTGMRYNKAKIAVESNGVGQAVVSLLREWEYPNLVYEGPNRPGLTTTSQSLDAMTTWLIDALLDELKLYDKQTVEQLMTYRHDKRIEESAQSEIVRGSASRRRRERHHWDKVSALLLAVAAARRSPSRRRVSTDLPAGENPIHAGLYRFSEQTARWKSMQRKAPKSDPWYKR